MRFGEAESLTTPMWEEDGTSVRAIAAYLASLWDVDSAAVDGHGAPTVHEKGLPHARASVLNLIVPVVDEAAADRVVHTLGGLGVRHPSRAIVLVPEGGAGKNPIDARVSTRIATTSPEPAIGSATRRSCSPFAARRPSTSPASWRPS